MIQHKHLSAENFNQHVREVDEKMNSTIWQADGKLNGNKRWEAVCGWTEYLSEDDRGSLEIPASFQRAMSKVWELIVYDTNNSPQDVVKTYYITEPIYITESISIDGEKKSKESGARIYVETFSWLKEDNWQLNTRVGLLTNIHSPVSSVLITENENGIKSTELSLFPDDGRPNWPSTVNPTVQLDVKADEKENNLSISESLSADNPYFEYDKYRGPFDPRYENFDPTTQLYVAKDEKTSSGCSETDDELQAKIKDADIRQQGQFDALMEKPRPSYPDMHLSKEERMARGKTDPVLDRLEALEHDLTEVRSALISKDIMRTH